jgi:hypothetical protein
MPLASDRRWIYFANPAPGPNGFKLGYVEIDENGLAVTRQAIRVFDPTTTSVCVPLGSRGSRRAPPKPDRDAATQTSPSLARGGGFGVRPWAPSLLEHPIQDGPRISVTALQHRRPRRGHCLGG